MNKTDHFWNVMPEAFRELSENSEGKVVGLEQSAVDYWPHAPLFWPPVTHTCLHFHYIWCSLMMNTEGGLAVCLALVGG